MCTFSLWTRRNTFILCAWIAICGVTAIIFWFGLDTARKSAYVESDLPLDMDIQHGHISVVYYSQHFINSSYFWWLSACTHVTLIPASELQLHLLLEDKQQLESSGSQSIAVLHEIGSIDPRTEELVRSLRKTGQCPVDTAVVPYRGDIQPRRRTVLHILHPEFYSASRAADAVTLVVQADTNRLHMLEDITTRWEGPIVACFRVNATMFETLLKGGATSSMTLTRNDVGLIFVLKNETLYHINWMRNLGLKYSLTSSVFPIDIDFIPSAGMYGRLQKLLVNVNLELGMGPYAIIIAAFESITNIMMPSSKHELNELVKQKEIRQYRQVNLPGQKKTNYTRFSIDSGDYYKLNLSQKDCFEEYEPYFIIRKSADIYLPETLMYRFRDKTSFFTQLCVRRFAFYVSSQDFILHRPHAANDFTIKGVHSNHLYLCCNEAWIQFRKYLTSKDRN